MQVRAAVNVLNILSSVASLAMVGYGSLIVMLAHFDPLHTDYVGVALGFAFIVPFLIIPPICVVASIRLARRDRRSSIFVALIPVALTALAILVWHEVPWPRIR
jgi:hypothetical protein